MAIDPMIKFVEFLPQAPFSGGDKILYFHDCPGGISYSKAHLNPVAGRRTQDGSLITQTARYNKKDFDLTFSFFDVTLGQYFESLYESGVRLTLKVWYENPSTFAEETEFNSIVQILNLNEGNDQSATLRTLTLNISEV